MVGALLCEPVDPTCVAGVVFFNNVGTIDMCGHGTIGVAVTLAHLGRIGPGTHRLETPVGVVSFEYHGDHRVTVENVPSYRHVNGVTVDVAGHGPVTGDVAWGGNWFFLVNHHGQELDLRHVERLTEFTGRIRQALERQGITGSDGEPRSITSSYSARRAIRRTTAATSSSAPARRMTARRAAPAPAPSSPACSPTVRSGKATSGVRRASSAASSRGRVRRDGERVIPRITGSAYVTAEATLLLDPDDPFCMGIRQ